MTGLELEPYRVVAYNSARQSENRMHDDAVARTFGFAGGLVPGVDVYAYMTHPAVACWGRAFLDRGTLDARFLKPVYDGEPVTVKARRASDGLDIEVTSRDALCATGHATLAGPAAPPIDDFEPIRPVEHRPAADEETLRVGRLLGIRPVVITAQFAAQYYDDVRETDPIYGAEALCHPGLLPRLFNWALMHNVVLGPWIHVSSKVEHFRAPQVGDEITVRSKVVGNYDRKGHRFVELDGLAVVNGTSPIARVGHTAIYRPRVKAETA